MVCLCIGWCPLVLQRIFACKHNKSSVRPIKYTFIVFNWKMITHLKILLHYFLRSEFKSVYPCHSPFSLPGKNDQGKNIPLAIKCIQWTQTLFLFRSVSDCSWFSLFPFSSTFYTIFFLPRLALMTHPIFGMSQKNKCLSLYTEFWEYRQITCYTLPGKLFSSAFVLHGFPACPVH